MNTEHLRAPLPGGRTLVLLEGDLCGEPADALVNAANEHLAHGGGVAAALSRAAGPALQEESDAWVREHGEAGPDRPAVTGPGALPCRAVVHVVGPVWGEGDEDRLLATAVRAGLEAAADRGFASIALPAVSTGIFGFPLERAARITLDAVRTWCAGRADGTLGEIRFVLFDADAVAAFEAAAGRA